ncbi:MAG: hypothetical protein AMJ64_08960 [Betaproteobacteria bacterium SG8_39]|nr:MAG: hypothetical protein AMJ64_08960 [Betaproteobacteria bacterium SG8_39]
MNPRRRGLLAALAVWPLLMARAGDVPGRVRALPISTLSPGAALPAWLEPYAFEDRPQRTEFALVRDAGRTVLRARAKASTAGLVRRLSLDPNVYPMLEWDWKVMNLIKGSDIATRAGDDFPARLYVTFDVPLEQFNPLQRVFLALARALWGEALPLAALCYVWDGRGPVGTMVPNAYTERVRMVVAESGSARLGRWLRVQRNVAEDYRRAFGADDAELSRRPVPPVNSVVVSSDTDNTGETAEAYFGDVSFRAAPGR